jgi:hypothetical protein
MTGDVWEVRTLPGGLALELRGAHSTSVPGFASLGRSRGWCWCRAATG